MIEARQLASTYRGALSPIRIRAGNRFLSGMTAKGTECDGSVRHAGLQGHTQKEIVVGGVGQAHIDSADALIERPAPEARIL